MGTKIARKTQKIFGVNAGPTGKGVFGSFAAGAPAYNTDVETIQSLPAWLTGWLAAVVGEQAPAVEDMNAAFFVFAYQLAYLMQTGIPEWDAETEYFIGSVAADSTGVAYTSIANNNLNNALTDTSKWSNKNAATVVTLNPATQSPYTLTAADIGKIFCILTANAPMQFNLPAAIQGFIFCAVDKSGNALANNITFARNGSESIQGVASNYIAKADWGSWTPFCDGTNWFFKS